MRGIKFCQDLAQDFGLHIFNCAKAKHDLQKWVEGGDDLDDWQ